MTLVEKILVTDRDDTKKKWLRIALPQRLRYRSSDPCSSDTKFFKTRPLEADKTPPPKKYILWRMVTFSSTLFIGFSGGIDDRCTLKPRDATAQDQSKASSLILQVLRSKIRLGVSDHPT